MINGDPHCELASTVVIVPICVTQCLYRLCFEVRPMYTTVSVTYVTENPVDNAFV